MEKQLEVQSKEIEFPDPEWTEDDLMWVMCWIDLVQQNRPSKVAKDKSPTVISGTVIVS